MNIAFWGERYEQEREKEEDIKKWTERIKTQNEASYLNLPMNKEEYEKFWNDFNAYMKQKLKNQIQSNN